MFGITRAVAAFLPLAAAALRDPRKVAVEFRPDTGSTEEHGTQTGERVALAPDSPESLDVAGFLPLCSEEIVEDTCLLLNADEKHADGDDWTTSEQLEEQLASYKGGMAEFWEALGVPQNKKTENGEDFWVECHQLCEAVVSYVKNVAICPPASDISCYSIGGESYCDLDVRPSILKQQGPTVDKDMPDFGDKDFLQQIDDDSPQPKMRGREMPKEEHELVHYHLWEMVERVANLFRIYPTERPDSLVHAETDEEDVDEEELEDESTGSLSSPGSLLQTHSGMTPSEARLNKQKEELAKAYMGIVIRAFSGRQTQTQMSSWFGSAAFRNLQSRKEILRVLNSIDHMISNVVYVYPGPKCSPNTYAYVYPQAYKCRAGTQESRPCTTMKGSNKYVFYLCPLYFKRPSEMVETLVHEGSHHATAFTDDVDFDGGTAYGRSTCQKLARADPALALKNADNFCYYIQDTATQVSDTRSEASTSGPSCPDFARVHTPDKDGDCLCPSSEQCFYQGNLGCPFSSTPRENTHSTAYFSANCEGCSCRAKPAATTATTTMIHRVSSTCPSFSGVSRPDRDGDCFCYGQMMCMFRGSPGCPYSGTAQNQRYSHLYFHSGCSECFCTRRSRAKQAPEVQCPPSALTKVPDREGDCHCPASQHCTFENQTGCPIADAYAKHHRYFDANCTSCECVPDA